MCVETDCNDFPSLRQSVRIHQDVLPFKVLLYCYFLSNIHHVLSCFQFLELLTYLHMHYAWALFVLENVPKYSCVCGLDTF